MRRRQAEAPLTYKTSTPPLRYLFPKCSSVPLFILQSSKTSLEKFTIPREKKQEWKNLKQKSNGSLKTNFNLRVRWIKKVSFFSFDCFAELIFFFLLFRNNNLVYFIISFVSLAACTFFVFAWFIAWCHVTQVGQLTLTFEIAYMIVIVGWKVVGSLKFYLIVLMFTKNPKILTRPTMYIMSLYLDST